MTNRDYQDYIVSLLENGCTVLAETERFVRQVQRLFRLGKFAAGNSAWDSPKILTLNRWMESVWSLAWPDEWPASTFERWRILRNCIDSLPPPGPVSREIGLIHLLDETFEDLIRHGLDPGKGDATNGLIEWRREIWRIFSEQLGSERLFHPAQLPRKILEIFHKLPISPSPMTFAGFEFAGGLEKQLLGAMKNSIGASFLPLPSGGTQPRSIVFPGPGQEIIGLMESLLTSSAHTRPGEIGVVVLDPGSYGQDIANFFEDLLGEPLDGDLAAYNLSPDTYLSDRPLFQAALLPLVFAAGGQTRRDLFAFLRSPYYGEIAPWSRRFSEWDLEWRKRGIDAGLFELMRTVSAQSVPIFTGGGEELASAFAPLLGGTKKTALLWTADLRRIWTRFEFPIIANEVDRISWRNLEDMLCRFEKGFGKTELGLQEFLDLLSLAASSFRVEKKGVDDAGIQVLGRLDARGLAFEKVFAVGLISGILPRPVRPLPLMGADERGKVPGGTHESQLALARYIFGNILASAPDVTLSRPAIGRDGEVCLPSPFWPVEEEIKAAPVIPWKDELRAMRRAEWVRAAVSGMIPGEELPSDLPRMEDFNTAPVPFSEPVSVSALEVALLCPARFAFRHILHLDELPQIEAGIAPPEKGQRIHEILAEFVSRAIPAVRSGKTSFEELSELLKRVVTEKLAPDQDEAAWKVEQERLTGNDDFEGLLLKWLEGEWKRIEAGWSWLCVESSFTEMELPGSPVRIKGRLDRIDRHAGGGLACWDYKTGKVPTTKDVRESARAHQLPAYLLAIKKGMIRGLERTEGGCGAGYIDLAAPRSVKHIVCFNSDEDCASFLEKWQEKVAFALNLIASGDISPVWLKNDEPCDEKCPYRDLCGTP